LVGIISIGDVVRHLMNEKNAAIRDLESYILKNKE
jgi:CBS domain-containing protein